MQATCAPKVMLAKKCKHAFDVATSTAVFVLETVNSLSILFFTCF